MFNCATSTSHYFSMREPGLDLDANGRGVINILKAVRRFNFQAKLVHLGTSTQLGKLCSEIPEAINMVAKFTEMKTKIPVEVIHLDEPKNQSLSERRNFISDSKAFSLSTGWEPQHTIEDGIDKTIDSFFGAGIVK